MPIMQNFMPINDDDACAKFTYFPKHIRHSLWWQHIHKQNYALKLRFQRQNNRSLWPILSNRFGFSHLVRRENKKIMQWRILARKMVAMNIYSKPGGFMRNFATNKINIHKSNLTHVSVSFFNIWKLKLHQIPSFASVNFSGRQTSLERFSW